MSYIEYVRSPQGQATATARPGIGGGKPYATLVIAASDSIAEDADKADFVCDGTDDNVEIEAAIDQLVGSEGTVGGRLLFLEGNYNITEFVNILQTGPPLTLQGQGVGSVLHFNESNSATLFHRSESGTTTTLVIKDLLFTTFEGETTSGNAIDISAEENSFILIQNCVFINMGCLITEDGFTPVHGIITGCYFSDENDQINPFDFFTSPLSHGIIAGNIVDGAGRSGLEGDLSSAVVSNNMILAGNRTAGNHDGLQFFVEKTGVALGNSVSGNYRFGLSLDAENPSGWVLAGNIAQNSDTAGISLVNHSLCLHNFLLNAGHAGLDVADDENSIQANVFRSEGDSDYGIHAHPGFLGSADDNFIANNHLATDSFAASAWGVAAIDMTDGTGTVFDAGNRT